MTDNILPFRRRADTGDKPYDWGDIIAYATLYSNGVSYTLPDGEPPDPEHIADAMFDATFSTLENTENCLAIISIGDMRTQTYRRKAVFDTPEQRAWLARRLDHVYKDFTGRSRNPIRAFLSRLNPFHEGCNP